MVVTLVEETKEPKEPTVYVLANLRLECDYPWEFKMKKHDLEDLAKKVQKAYDFEPKKDWLRMLGDEIVKNLTYAPILDYPFAYDTLHLADAIEELVGTIKEEFGINTDRPPKQQSINEGKQ